MVIKHSTTITDGVDVYSKAKWEAAHVIDDDSIGEGKLIIVNGPTDTYVLAWSDADGKLKWIANTHAQLHDPVTLSTELDAILALSTQALDLGTQPANFALRGPASGAAAKPTFRADVAADIPDHTLIAELVDPAAAASLTISGLDGDTDEVYRVVAKIRKDATPGHISLRFNGDATAGQHRYTLFEAVGNAAWGGNANQSTTSAFLDYNDANSKVAADDLMDVMLTIFAKSGTVRRFTGQTVFIEAGGRGMDVCMVGGEWKDTAANLTSLVFLPDAGNIGGAGTFIRVYKMG